MEKYTIKDLSKAVKRSDEIYGGEVKIRTPKGALMFGGKADNYYVATYGYYRMIGETLCKGTINNIIEYLEKNYPNSFAEVNIDPSLTNGL